VTQPLPYAIVTVAYRSGALLAGMFERIPPPTPIVVVDNSAGEEDIRDLVAARPGATYIDAGGNVGFGAACNLAAQAVAEPLLAFVNPDADVDPAVLDRLARAVSADPSRSSAGPLLVDDDGQVRSGSGGWLPTPLRAAVHATGIFRVLTHRGIWLGPGLDGVTEVEWLAGTCLVIRRDVFVSLGGFASRYFLYQEDMDLGRRLRDAGYTQLLLGDVRVRHVAGTSSARPDVSRLAWLRASALVDYMAATNRPSTARVICGLLALGGVPRATYDLLRGRTGRLEEFRIHAATLARPGKTLARVAAERQARAAARDAARASR
jgi:N-acetylglucosaminyl-diphospho-decaprenol L-rhamnosyltransferase